MKREPAIWRPMTQLEYDAIVALQPGVVTYIPGSPPKRFARDLMSYATMKPLEITEKQAAALWRQAWRYRRQVADKLVAAEAKRRHEAEIADQVAARGNPR